MGRHTKVINHIFNNKVWAAEDRARKMVRNQMDHRKVTHLISLISHLCTQAPQTGQDQALLGGFAG